jgi:hypothetical protein
MCGRHAWFAVEYSTVYPPVWWCTRCGGVSSSGDTYQSSSPSQSARDARDQLLRIPLWTSERRRLWRKFSRQMAEHGIRDS